MLKNVKVIAVVVVILCAIGYIVYQGIQIRSLRQDLAKSTSTLTEANLELGRAHTQLTEAEKLHVSAMGNLEKQLQDEIKRNKALVTMYAELQALYEAAMEDGDLDLDFKDGELFTRDGENYKLVDSLPFSYSDFRLTLAGDAIKKKLSYNLHQNFRAQVIETRTPDGKRQHYATLYELDDKGNEVGKAKLDKFEVVVSDNLPNRFRWFNPKVDLRVGVGVTNQVDPSWTVDGGISFMSYGKTEDDIAWRFARVGAGVTKNDFSLSLSPFQYNIGKNLPLLSNTWLSPSVSYVPRQNLWSFEGSVSVVF